jgi:hypothetical protein
MRKAADGELSMTPVPTSNARPADLKRRRFLFTLGASGAGAVAVASTLPGTAAAQLATAPSTDEDSGYRETAHVRDYYRTAKI